MTDTLKVLAQSNPLATTLTDAYTVGSGKSAVVSTLVVCNRSSSSRTFRVSVAIAGAANANSQYLYYDVTIEGNSTFTATLGITLAATDVVRVYASTTDLTFSLFGVEVT